MAHIFTAFLTAVKMLAHRTDAAMHESIRHTWASLCVTCWPLSFFRRMDMRFQTLMRFLCKLNLYREKQAMISQ